MKKAGFLILAISTLVMAGSLASGQERERGKTADTITVQNPLAPISVPGEPHKLVLQREYLIDLKSQKVLEQGLVNPVNLEVDDAGFIYVHNQAANEGDRIIYKFDKRGFLVQSFGRFGRSSGEIFGNPRLGGIDGDGHLHFTNRYFKTHWHIFSADGRLLKTYELADKGIDNISPLANGRFVVSTVILGQSITSDPFRYSFHLCDPRLNELKLLARWELLPLGKGLYPRYRIRVIASPKHIYIGDPAEGYVIRVYDLDGNLIRIVRKEYEGIPVTKSVKAEVIDDYKEFSGKNVSFVFSKTMPAFSNMFVDEQDRLYVCLSHNEKTDRLIDIFNRDGICIAQIKGPAYNTFRVKNGRLYCFSRDSIAGYRMKWE